VAFHVGLAACATTDDVVDLLIPVFTRPRRFATHHLLAAEFSECLLLLLDHAHPLALAARTHNVMSVALLGRADNHGWDACLCSARALLSGHKDLV
jgi:hypothetical protein